MNLAPLSTSRHLGLLIHPETQPRIPINCGTPVIVAAAARCFFSKVLDATGTLPDTILHEIPDQLRDALTVGREIEPRS